MIKDDVWKVYNDDNKHAEADPSDPIVSTVLNESNVLNGAQPNAIKQLNQSQSK